MFCRYRCRNRCSQASQESISGREVRHHHCRLTPLRRTTRTFSSNLSITKTKSTFFTTFIMTSFARNIIRLTNIAPFLPRLVFSSATSITEKSIITTDITREKTVMFLVYSFHSAKLLSEPCIFNRFGSSCWKTCFQVRK